MVYMSPKQPAIDTNPTVYRNNHLQTGGVKVKKGENAKAIKQGLHLFLLPKIDLHNYNQLRDRLTEYFDYMEQQDTKPTVAGMALALGIDRFRLYEIRSGTSTNARGVKDLPPECVNLIKEAYEILEVLMENYIQNGKVNPVAGIFLAKNHFRYTNETEVVVKPGQQALDSEYSVDEIKKRYQLTEGEQLSDE